MPPAALLSGLFLTAFVAPPAAANDPKNLMRQRSKRGQGKYAQGAHEYCFNMLAPFGYLSLEYDKYKDRSEAELEQKYKEFCDESSGKGQAHDS
jgi:hypothetical protein